MKRIRRTHGKRGVALFVGVKGDPSEGGRQNAAPTKDRQITAQHLPYDVGTTAPGRPQCWARVFYTDLWGTRENKFRQLNDGALQFTEVDPDSKMAYLIPYGGENKETYDKGISIAELFEVNTTGLKSGNDNVAIAPSKDELLRRINIVKNAVDDSAIFNLFGRFTRDQTAEKIRNDVLHNDGAITKILYRPFDVLWTFYTGKSGGWHDMPREKKTMGQLLTKSDTPIGRNIGLVFARCDSPVNDFL